MPSLLDDVLNRLQQLPEAERKAIEEEAYAATAGMKWIPSAGPQTEAYFSKADILLYGGSGGAGKSDLGLGLAFTAHKRSLILRRKYTNLDGLIDRALQINGSREGFNGKPPPRLTTSDGRLIVFGANQHLGDEQGFQGQPFDLKCVGKGTMVLMAGGDYKAIEAIRAGDCVATLSGSRRVNRVIPAQHKEAVLVEAVDARGSVIGSQVQSLSHSLYDGEEWVSYDTFCESRPSETSLPTQSPAAHKFALRSASQSWLAGLRRAASSLGLPRRKAPSQLFADHPHSQEKHVSYAGSVRESDCGSSCGEHPDAWRPLLWTWFSGTLSIPQRLWAFWSFPPFSSNGVCDARTSSSPEDWMGHCSFGSRPCGEHIRQYSDLCSEPVGGLLYLPQSSGAEQPSPTRSEAGGPGRTPRRTRCLARYVHPYTKGVCRTRASGLICSFRYTRVGVAELYDIEVDEVRHYITDCGFINKNCFDEATQFLEQQVRFHIGWLRNADDPNQRTRAILPTNPPLDADGEWVIGFFRPWLDITHPKPAKHGELRYFVTDPDGKDLEVDGPNPVELGGRKLVPHSRTFIPGTLSNNPYLIRTDYQAKLDSLPEPLRSAVRDGNFMAARQDADFQVIPTAWIIAAQARWSPQPPTGMAMTAQALDPAGGGRDSMELSSRYGGWYSELVSAQGEETADGSSSAATVIKHRRDNCPVIVDTGGGYGGSVMMRLKDNGIAATGFNGSTASSGKTKDGQLSFVNLRAEAWWKFREALDPDQEGGSVIALPPDPELRADLAAPTWNLTQRGILIESKDDIRKRLGRSPGKGDSVVMCLSQGDRAVMRARSNQSGKAPKVVMGYTSRRR